MADVVVVHLLAVTIILLLFLVVNKIRKYARKCKSRQSNVVCEHCLNHGDGQNKVCNPVYGCRLPFGYFGQRYHGKGDNVDPTLDNLNDSYRSSMQHECNREQQNPNKCKTSFHESTNTCRSHGSQNFNNINPLALQPCEQSDDISPTGGNAPLDAIFKVSNRSTNKLIGSKNVYSIARQVGYAGDKLILDNVGISLIVPIGAVPEGQEKLISLVLDWDLTDNPSLTRNQSLVSPVVYIGPHGLELMKPCVLSYKHCAFDPRMIQVYYTETDLLDGKNWSVLCNMENNERTTMFTQEECQITITSFTLYTCVQTPPEGIAGKKWLQIAAFSYPLRPLIDHHQVRVYMLNKTPCALQWAIQKEAKFGGRLCCPEKVFLFDGGEQDIILETRYVSTQWCRIEEDGQERVNFLNIWHGQCPYVSMCFRRKITSSQELGFKFFVFQEQMENEGEKVVVHITEDPSAPSIERICDKHEHEQIRVDIRHPELKNIVLQIGSEKPAECLQKLAGTMPPRNIPQELRSRIKCFMDAPNAFDNNWKTLASRLGLDNLIPILTNKASPTDSLLDHIEEKNIKLSEVQEHLRAMNRQDVVDMITKFTATQSKQNGDTCDS